MIERQVNIATRDGKADTFVCHPERGGPFPAIIFYMDAPGIREELFDMARRIASVGYYVVLPNLFYRHGPGTTPGPNATDDAHPDHARMFELLKTLDNGMIVQDTAAILSFIDGEPQARKDRAGALGYCMSGPFAIAAAAAFPERIACAASMYGVGIVTDRPDSAHLMFQRAKGELYLGFGEADPLTPPRVVAAVREALARAKARNEVEIYPGGGHGFGFPQRKTYNKALAERHWERLFALFSRTLHA